MFTKLARLLSYAWPVRVWKGDGASGALELTWEYGRLVVNSANANQSFGSLHRVWREAFRDAGIKDRPPAATLILGYGAGSVAHILQNELGSHTMITGVDHDETMLRLAREHFPLKRSELIHLVRSDAFTFAATTTATFDLIVVDLFADLDFAQGVETPDFLQAIRRLASPSGRVLLNTVVHDEKSAQRSARLWDELRLVFTEVKEHHYDGSNRVFIAL